MDLIEASWEGGYANQRLFEKELDGLRKAGLDIPDEPGAAD